MTVTLRVILIIMSVLAVIYTLRKIRKAQLNIDDSIYWIGVSVLLLVMSIFPQLVSWGAQLLGFVAPANFVFVVMIFVVIVKLFQVAVDLSVAKHRLNLLIQKIALLNKQSEDNTIKEEVTSNIPAQSVSEEKQAEEIM